MKPVNIIDRGRGPEIEGTRVNAYDVYPYWVRGQHHSYIAALLGISSCEVRAMFRYIEANKEEVETVHRRIEERNALGNSPEVEEKLKMSRQKLLALKHQLHEQGNGHEGNSCRQ